DLALYDNESWNDPRDFAKSVNAISLPQDVLSTSDRRLIELKNQVQRLMEAHLASMRSTQVNKITFSCEIYSGPHDTQYCIENPKQASAEYASSRTDEAGVLSARSYPTEDPQCSTYIHGSINTIIIHQCNPHDDMPEVDEQKREGNPENTNTVELKEEQSGIPQLDLKDPTAITKTEPSRGDEEGKIEWVDVEEPLDLVDTCE
ncbi:hypothetical protein Tco_1325638, partial [Tanacetum coccineum]